MPGSRSLFLLLVGGLALAACRSTPLPPLPRLEGTGTFAVGYHGEVVPLGAAEHLPDPVVEPRSNEGARLVTVRVTLVELAADAAERLVPALLAPGAQPAPAPAAAPAPTPAPNTPTGLQPRKREDPPQGPFRVPGSTLAKDPDALATMRGVHVDPASMQQAIVALRAGGRARLLGEPEVSCAEGSEAAVSCLDQTALVERVDLVPNGATGFAFDLGIGIVQHGSWLQLSPHRTTEGKLALGIRLQLRELVQPVPVAETRFGRIQVPVVAIQDLRALETVAEHDALVLGTMSGQQPGVVVLALVQFEATPTGKPARPEP